VREWVEDLAYWRKRDTKYLRIAETYQLVKTLVAQALEKDKEDQQEIVHSLRIFEGKFKAVCSKVFGVKIIITKVIDEDDKGKTRIGSTSSVGTRVNLIRVDDAPQQHEQA
jgi:hypothetical protein